MTSLEKQITTLLGLTGTLNVLDAIEHVKTLKRLLATTEQQRKDWADMCIKKQTKIEKLAEVLRTFCDCPEFVIENPEIFLNAQGKPISSKTLEWAKPIIEKYETKNVVDKLVFQPQQITPEQQIQAIREVSKRLQGDKEASIDFLKKAGILPLNEA